MADVTILKEASDIVLADLTALLSALRGTPQTCTREELEQMLRTDTTRIFVAREGEHILGVAFLFIVAKLGKRIGYVEDVVVSEEARGGGLGRKLMEAVIAEARAEKLVNMFLTSKPARVAANALYQKLGFELVETNPYRLTL